MRVCNYVLEDGPKAKDGYEFGIPVRIYDKNGQLMNQFELKYKKEEFVAHLVFVAHCAET